MQNRSMNLMLILLLLISQGFAEDQPGGCSPGELAAIELFNPTEWNGMSVVEVPCGDLGTSDAIDWERIQLSHGGIDVPFAIVDGDPHWKSTLKAPVHIPRSHDLLVFGYRVAPNQSVRISVTYAERQTRSRAVLDQGTSLSVSYPGINVVIDRQSGLIQKLEYSGESLLPHPMTLQAAELTAPPATIQGNLAAWRALGDVRLNVGEKVADFKATLISQVSTPAITELNFLLSGAASLEIGLTYRIHAAGVIEILADGRPWKGASPWCDQMLTWGLELNGSHVAVPNLENRWPAYGFKDYFSVVKHPADLHRIGGVTVGMLGEEIINGRRWNRRIFLSDDKSPEGGANMLKAADEGLVVQLRPHMMGLDATAATIAAPTNCLTIARQLADQLRQLGVSTDCSDSSSIGKSTIVLELASDPQGLGLIGDGFRIDPGHEHKTIRIVSGTRFGLMQAVSRIASRIEVAGVTLNVPQIASNPIAPIRAGGFGGGDHEVDFPYGTDGEWQHAFDGMIASGMNTVTCLGMWSDWKMPVTYDAMPELKSTSPQAHDEVTGTALKDVDTHRARGLQRLEYLHERGVKVWLWIPVGCVPTTFADRYPEAMCEGSRTTPDFAHPQYHRYLKVFFEELLKTYPIDGVVLIRDDNGMICKTPAYLELVKKGRSKDPIWEQYLLMYDKLKELDFSGEIAVYPYNDFYRPEHEAFLPRDLVICGHGSGLGMLSRDFERLAPMGDTWLDNLYCEEFALPPSTRMKRLLGDRSSFWLGGAYTGTELPIEAIGYFGWNSHATPNSLRQAWGHRTFGSGKSFDFVRWSDANEQLWDSFAWPLMPGQWAMQDDARKATVIHDVRRSIEAFSTRLATLRNGVDASHQPWFQHVGLTAELLEWRVTFLENADRIANIMRKHDLKRPGAPPLPASIRQELALAYRRIDEQAAQYNRALAAVPGKMMSKVVQAGMTVAWIGMAERLVGMEWYSHTSLGQRPLNGQITIEPVTIAAGKAFTLRCRVRNTGFYPWQGKLRPTLSSSQEAQQLSLTRVPDTSEPQILYGDEHIVEFHGMAPGIAGEATVTWTLSYPDGFGENQSEKALLRWTAP